MLIRDLNAAKAIFTGAVDKEARKELEKNMTLKEKYETLHSANLLKSKIMQIQTPLELMKLHKKSICLYSNKLEFLDNSAQISGIFIKQQETAKERLIYDR
ncbi:MAG: hypothetical protein GX297_03405 [Treponema sp.]|nr:hypothetical protein [Treponema sp.]